MEGWLASLDFQTRPQERQQTTVLAFEIWRNWRGRRRRRTPNAPFVQREGPRGDLPACMHVEVEKNSSHEVGLNRKHRAWPVSVEEVHYASAGSVAQQWR